MKNFFAGTLVGLVLVAATAFAAVGPSLALAPAGEVDDAVVNAKIDARLHQQLRAALAERIQARQLASR